MSGRRAMSHPYHPDEVYFGHALYCTSGLVLLNGLCHIGYVIKRTCYGLYKMGYISWCWYRLFKNKRSASFEIEQIRRFLHASSDEVIIMHVLHSYNVSDHLWSNFQGNRYLSDTYLVLVERPHDAWVKSTGLVTWFVDHYHNLWFISIAQ